MCVCDPDYILPVSLWSLCGRWLQGRYLWRSNNNLAVLYVHYSLVSMVYLSVKSNDWYRLERVGQISLKEKQRVTVVVDSGHNWRENGMNSQSELALPCVPVLTFVP